MRKDQEDNPMESRDHIFFCKGALPQCLVGNAGPRARAPVIGYRGSPQPGVLSITVKVTHLEFLGDSHTLPRSGHVPNLNFFSSLRFQIQVGLS